MQIAIPLDNKARRPIAHIDWFEGCRALIDTGALFPIWNMILSATMFDGMTYEIDTINKKLNINTRDNQPVRILKLSDDNNSVSVYLAGTYKTDNEYLNRNRKHDI